MSLLLRDASKILWEMQSKSTGSPVIADVIDLGVLFPFSELLLKRAWVTIVQFY